MAARLHTKEHSMAARLHTKEHSTAARIHTKKHSTAAGLHTEELDFSFKQFFQSYLSFIFSIC